MNIILFLAIRTERSPQFYDPGYHIHDYTVNHGDHTHVDRHYHDAFGNEVAQPQTFTQYHSNGFYPHYH